MGVILKTDNERLNWHFQLQLLKIIANFHVTVFVQILEDICVRKGFAVFL